MRLDTKIRIEDYYDGFAVIIEDKRWSISDEDTRKDLEKVFKYLGFVNTEYEESY